MANKFEFVDWVGEEALRSLTNRLVIAEMFNTDYNKEFTREFAVGEDVRVKYPQRFLVANTFNYTPQPINRRHTDIVLNVPLQISFEYDSFDQALKMERGKEMFNKEYIQPAMEQLAQEIESQAANFAWLHANNIVGSLATTPTDTSQAGSARQRLLENACPDGGEYRSIITPGAMTSVANGSTTVFNPQDEISRIWKKGYVGEARGFNWFESMSLYQMTAGNWQTPANNTFNSLTNPTTLVMNCTNGDTFNAGDVFNIAGMYNVNPVTRRSTGTLKQIRITQSTTATSTTVTLSISCGDGQGIVLPGDQYQNVDSAPVANNLCTLMPGTTNPSGLTGFNGLALTRDAFALVGVKLMMPEAVEIAVQKRDPKTGISTSFIRVFDGVQRKMINRFDMLIGFGELYSNACCVRQLSAT
jgi:P22 coat protein - gene protein 5